MPRVPNELLERLKQEIAIVRLVERAGVVLRGTSDNLETKCSQGATKATAATEYLVR